MWWALNVKNLLMRLLDPAFGHPRGLPGRIGGSLMARGNAGQEQWAVESAQLQPGERVLVISVNNILLWNLHDGFAEVERVLRPGGRLVVTVHRHVLGRHPDELRRAGRSARGEQMHGAGAVLVTTPAAERSGWPR